MKKIASLLALTVLVSTAPILSGCASDQQHTRTVEQTTTNSTGAPNNQTTTTTTTTTDKSSTKEPDSVLGATAHAIGTVILFPFRLIGDAVGLIV